MSQYFGDGCKEKEDRWMEMNQEMDPRPGLPQDRGPRLFRRAEGPLREGEGATPGLCLIRMFRPVAACLLACLSACLPVRPSVRRSVCRSICKPASLSVGLSVLPSMCLFVFFAVDARRRWRILFLKDVGRTNLAVGQHQWYHFGVGAPPILVYFSGDWDVHGGVRFGF